MRRSNPKHYWIQVVNIDDELIKQYRVFVTPQAAQDKAEYEARQPNVEVVWIIDGKAKPRKLNEPVSLDNPIIPTASETLNRVEPKPFTEDGKQSIPVDTTVRITRKSVAGRLLQDGYVKSRVWAKS